MSIAELVFDAPLVLSVDDAVSAARGPPWWPWGAAPAAGGSAVGAGAPIADPPEGLVG